MRVIYDMSGSSLYSLFTYFNYFNFFNVNISIIDQLNHFNMFIPNMWYVFIFENLNIFEQYINIRSLVITEQVLYSTTLLVFLNQNIGLWLLYIELILTIPLFSYNLFTYNINIIYLISWIYIFYIFYICILFYIILMQSSFLKSFYIIYWVNFVTLYIYLWIYGSIDKVESAEESYCLFILWPWCVFLIFTHLFTLDNHAYIFGFAEWALPVLYGLVLLIEHFWAFGTYILVYLLGLRGRSSFSLTFVEDIVAIIIMFARVILQAIRGIIVGMFHFICREALLNMTRWWEKEEWFAHSQVEELIIIGFSYDLVLILVDFFFAAGSLVIVMAIMFLQLIFLIVSVWLFCKCWFISWQPIRMMNFKTGNYTFWSSKFSS